MGREREAGRLIDTERCPGAAGPRGTAAPGGYSITRLSLPTPFRIGPVNAYLIEEEALTLVDTGPNYPDSLTALTAALALEGHRVEDLDRILLTHQHYDHFGLARTVKERSGAEVVAHELLAPFLDDVDRAMEADDVYTEAIMVLHGIDPTVIAELRRASLAARVYGASVSVDRTVREGDRIALGALELEVDLRPGHSPTDTIFTIPGDAGGAIAFVGDHLIEHVSSNPILHRPLTPAPDLRNRPSSLATYLESLQRTAAIDVAEILPGHGGPVIDHRPLVHERIVHHERRKDRILELLAEPPIRAPELIAALWPSLPTDQAFLALSEVLGHIDLLIAEGRVETSERDGVLEFARA